MINAEQIRAARAMLHLSQRKLAKEAGLCVATLNNIERGVQTDPRVSTMSSIQQTLENKGIEFTNAYEGFGVVMKPAKNSGASATVLVIDDSREDRTLYKQWLGKKYRVVEAENARAGYGALNECHPDCIVLDFKMHGADGYQFLTEMKREHPRLPPIVFVTGLQNNVLKESVEKYGVSTYLEKRSLTREGFYDAIERALA